MAGPRPACRADFTVGLGAQAADRDALGPLGTTKQVPGEWGVGPDLPQTACPLPKVEVVKLTHRHTHFLGVFRKETLLLGVCFSFSISAFAILNIERLEYLLQTAGRPAAPA